MKFDFERKFRKLNISFARLDSYERLIDLLFDLKEIMLCASFGLN